jgi:hypothetical protein
VEIGDYVRSNLCPKMFGKILTVMDDKNAILKIGNVLIVVNLNHWQHVK